MYSECCNAPSWSNLDVVEGIGVCAECLEKADFYDIDVDVDENGPFLITKVRKES